MKLGLTSLNIDESRASSLTPPRPTLPPPQEAVSEQLKQQQELQRKLAKLAKQMDHLERAKREEEAPLLAEAQKGRLQVGSCVWMGGSVGVRVCARSLS